jgi:hypothetical protein
MKGEKERRRKMKNHFSQDIWIGEASFHILMYWNLPVIRNGLLLYIAWALSLISHQAMSVKGMFSVIASYSCQCYFPFVCIPRAASLDKLQWYMDLEGSHSLQRPPSICTQWPGKNQRCGLFLNMSEGGGN